MGMAISFEKKVKDTSNIFAPFLHAYFSFSFQFIFITRSTHTTYISGARTMADLSLYEVCQISNEGSNNVVEIKLGHPKYVTANSLSDLIAKGINI